MTIYRVKMYSKFPKQLAKDKVMRTVDNLKSAQVISIQLNQAQNARYYVETVEVNDI